MHEHYYFQFLFHPHTFPVNPGMARSLRNNLVGLVQWVVSY